MLTITFTQDGPDFHVIVPIGETGPGQEPWVAQEVITWPHGSVRDWDTDVAQCAREWFYAECQSRGVTPQEYMK